MAKDRKTHLTRTPAENPSPWRSMAVGLHTRFTDGIKDIANDITDNCQQVSPRSIVLILLFLMGNSETTSVRVNYSAVNI